MPTPSDYRKTEFTHRRGSRADQPAANTVLDGTLYYVVDEGMLEQSNGTDWIAYVGAGARTSNLVNYSYSSNTASPPSTNQVRFNGAHPYTGVTKLYFDNVTADGQDVRVGLLRVAEGSTIYVQDKNDSSQYGVFQTTTAPVDHTTWVEYNVIHVTNGAAIGGGQLVLVQSTWGAITPSLSLLKPPISVTLAGGLVNNLYPAGLDFTQTIRLTGNSGPNSQLTGINPRVAGVLRGRLLITGNVGSANISFEMENANSDPENRFNFALNLGAGQVVLLWYDFTSARWRRVSA